MKIFKIFIKYNKIYEKKIFQNSYDISIIYLLYYTKNLGNYILKIINHKTSN